MDTTDSEIRFDESGICNHCRQYDELVRTHVLVGEDGQRKLHEIGDRIRREGAGKAYDCVLGLSGGCDSTYVAYLAKGLGLRPYLVTLDNGYDTETTKRNVERIAKYLGAEVNVYTIDPAEFRDMQLAYLRSGVINIEVLTDHAILALLYRTADRLRTKYVLSGVNTVTEGILPKSWGYDNKDVVNIVDICRKHGSGVKLKTFPRMSVALRLYYHFIKKITFVRLLDFVSYMKRDAKALFASEFGYEDYGPKHCESMFTRFYQFYILPRRLHVDKRRAHLSCLVCSGQMTRQEAIRELQQSPYAQQEQLEQDKRFVLGRLGLTEEELEALISQPVRSPFDFKTDRRAVQLLAFASRQYGRIRGRPTGHMLSKGTNV